MSINYGPGGQNEDTKAQEVTSSPKSTAAEETASLASKEEPASQPATNLEEGNQESETSSSLLSSLLSPFSSLLSSAVPQSTQSHDSLDGTKESAKKEETISNVPPKAASPPKTLTGKPEQPESALKDKEEAPEPYYAPAQVPAFKALQKKRLTGTRTKQLLRAAGRAHNDPPPPPELGLCCGSSCDPCVNDLYREELSVWKERWGDRGVEGAGKRKELVW